MVADMAPYTANAQGADAVDAMNSLIAAARKLCGDAE
jgi:hypothetical protein